MPHWILSSATLFPLIANSTLQISMVFSINCITSSGILYILSQCNIQTFPSRLLSLNMCCYSGKNLRFSMNSWFVPLAFSTSSIGTLWVCSYLRRLLWGFFLDQAGLPFGHPFGYLSFFHAFIHFGGQSTVDGGDFFKTKICVYHLVHGFSDLVFFKCGLECDEVYFLFRAFLEDSQFCFHVVYYLRTWLRFVRYYLWWEFFDRGSPKKSK